MSRAGANKKKLVAKLVGGASVLRTDSRSALPPIGEDNIRYSEIALQEAGIKLLWRDTGGDLGRKVLVDLREFRVDVRFLPKRRRGDSK